MARIRSVHPGFFTDEDLVSVSMAARLLFIGLGVEADDKGIFEWKPLTLKMRVFPADNVDVATLLTELADVGAVKKFEADGRAYGAIRNFRKFQKPKTPNDIHPASAEILAFAGLSISETKPAEEAPFPSKGGKSSQMEDGGGKREKEEKPDGSSSLARKRANPRPSGKTMLAEGWVPAEFGEGTKCRKIVDSWPPGEIDHQVEKFHASHTSRGSMFDDWQAAWKTWVLNSVEFRGRNDRPSQPPHAQRDTRDGLTKRLHEIAGIGDAAGSSGTSRRPPDGDGGGDRELPLARAAAHR